MTALHTALYTIALLSQMFVISIYLPTRLVDAVRQGLSKLDEPQADGYHFRRYLNRNRFVAILGLALVIVAWLSEFESSLTPILLTTGLYFFLQVAALIADRNVRTLFNGGLVMPQRTSRALIVAAVVAYVAYVAASLIHQNEAATSMWAKIQIVTLANVFFVFIVVANRVRMQGASTEESRIRRQGLGRSINVLAGISIGLSVYFFGKDALADLDMSGLRPLVMSVFLQALALLTVRAQLGTSITSARSKERR